MQHCNSKRIIFSCDTSEPLEEDKADEFKPSSKEDRLKLVQALRWVAAQSPETLYGEGEDGDV